MATAREMAEASPPYDSLPAYAGFKIPLNSIAGAGPDQCEPHWHHVNLPSGQTIRTDTDCHVGAEAMTNDNVRMQVDWGGKVPVTLDMRTKGDVVHGIATIHLPGVATPVRTTISLNWREIYNVLRNRGGATAGVSDLETAVWTKEVLRDLNAAKGASDDVVAQLDYARGTVKDILSDLRASYDVTTTALPMAEVAGAKAGHTEIGASSPSPAAAYAAALATLGILAAIAGSKKPKVTQAYGAALAALALMAAYAGATKRTTAGGPHLSSATRPAILPRTVIGDYAVVSGAKAKRAAYAAAVAALGVLAALAGAKANPGIARGDRAYLAGLTALGLLAAYAAAYAGRKAGAAAGQYPEVLTMGDTLIAGDTLATVPLFYPGGEVKVGEFNVTAPDMNVEINVGGEDEAGGVYGKGAALTALAAMVAAAGVRGRGAYSPGARALGDGRVGGSASYPLNAAAVALTAMGALGIASLAGDDTETLIAGGGAFDLLTKAKTIARSDVIKNLNRVVRKSLSNPLIRQAMQLDKQARAQFALKIGARVYGRAMNGDQAAKRAIKLLHEQYKKGSRFAARALRLMNLGRRQYYGAKISGDASTDNLELIGACVGAYGGAHHRAGADYDLELLLEAATGVGAWEGVDWIADRLKWQPMAGDPNQIGARGLLLAGRRAQVAAYTPGRL